MIGEGYWTTGITVWKVGGKWCIELTFLDNGFCDQDSTEGKLQCRYQVDDLGRGLDVLKADAERLGISFRDVGGYPPAIYYKGDGEWEGYEPPEGWRQILLVENMRLGWRSLYETA